MKSLRFMCLMCALVFSASVSLAQTPLSVVSQPEPAAPTAEPPSANDLHEFTRLLSDPRLLNWLVAQANGAQASAETAAVSTKSLGEQIDAVIAHVDRRVLELVAAWGYLDQTPEVIAAEWRAQLTANRQVQSLTFALIFLFFGAGLEWLSRQYTNPMLRRIEYGTFDSPRARIVAALTRSGLAFVGLSMFAIGSIGSFVIVDWPPLLYTLILSTVMGIVGVRVANTLIRLFLAPRVPQLRLVPVGNRMAKVLSACAMVFTALLIFTASLIEVFEQLDSTGGDAPETLAVSAFLAVGLLLAGMGLLAICFAQARKSLPQAKHKTMARWHSYLRVLAVAVLLSWLLNVEPLMWSLLSIGLTIPLLRLLRLWVDQSFDQSIAEFVTKAEAERAALPQPETEEEDAPEPEPITDPYETYRPIVQRLVRFGVLVSLGLFLAIVWNAGIFDRSDNPTVAQQLFSILIDSAAALLIADLVWTWGKTSIDRRLAAYRPPEDGQAPGPEARMATLLPLLRVVLLVVVLLVVVMSVLSSMGVNIAPILAGASVLGIAIGFGAQSLVKDVVSGIFFLIDDAFRVGEYVEIGELRGTVEKISIRSLQIRHHRGAVHTLPFGELKSMTNYSRDWVIMKLEFRVPFDTDLQLVKKLVKKVGAELKQDPHYGDAIIQTLKSQGVRRMEEFNMVVGVKFMTRPGEQWLVRRDAYQKVRDAFEANGIRMAERNVKVEISGDEHLSDEERKAATAAAQQAVEQQIDKPA